MQDYFPKNFFDLNSKNSLARYVLCVTRSFLISTDNLFIGNQMKNRSLVALALTSVMAIGFSTYASADSISCFDKSTDLKTIRTWGFDSADSCGTGEGNPNSTGDIEGLGGQFDLTSGIWTKRGDVTKNGDASSWLNVALTSGTWGDDESEDASSKVVTGTWALAAGFWETFGSAVFSVHVGHGSHDALSDFGAFFITQGQYSGTWSYAQNPINKKAGGAGGLSNAAIWTTGTGTVVEEPFPVPEPGILMLFASGLLGLAFGNRRKTKA